MKASSFFSKAIFQICRQMRRIDILKRLMTAFFVAILLPTCIIGFFSFRNLSNQNDQHNALNAKNRLRTLDTSISEKLEQFNTISYQLYLDEQLRSLLRESVQLEQRRRSPQEEDTYLQNQEQIGKILMNMQKKYPHLLNIEIVTEQGEYPSASPDSESQIHITDLESFRASPAYQQAKSISSLPLWDYSYQKQSPFQLGNSSSYLGQYITLYRSINEYDQFLGMIVMNISLNVFSQLSTSSEESLTEEYLLLLDDDGIITYFNSSKFLPFPPLSQKNISDILQTKGQTTDYQILNSDYQINTVTCSATTWTLASITLKSSLNQTLYDIVQTLIIITAVSLIVSFIMSYLVTYSIVNPVQRLCKAMNRIEIDSLQNGYVDFCPDEIGVLGRDFNKMLRRNQELIHKVYAIELEKNKETLRRKEAELDALQMQINPHFLYNTLDIIRWQLMEEEGKESKAGHMLILFSKLLKLSMRKTSKLVSVREEIDHVKTYLKVVEFDLEYPVTLHIDLTESVLNCAIPKLTFQPFFENAFVHAFQGNTRPANIWVYAEEKEKEVTIFIKNDGRPIEDEELLLLNQDLKDGVKNNHIGLRNVNERIKIYFGDAYGIAITKAEENRTTILIHIPKEDSSCFRQ